MLHAERGFHPELGAFFDGEGLVLEALEGSWGLQVDHEVRTAGDFEAEREHHDDARVIGVSVGGAAAGEAERFFVAAEGLIAGVCWEGGKVRLVSVVWVSWWAKLVGGCVGYVAEHWVGKKRRGEMDMPSFWYSSMVFFWPAL